LILQWKQPARLIFLIHDKGSRSSGTVIYGSGLADILAVGSQKNEDENKV
jgi:hypothetical protein